MFLDRDGTLNEDVGHLHAREMLHVFPWSIDAVRLLKRAGYAVVVVTNQSGIAMGFTREAFVRELHDEMGAMFAAAGAPVDGWYYCPHHVTGLLPEYRQDCDCRKPRPGMPRRAARDLDLDLSRSWTVGDKWLDVGLGHAIGGRSILVRTGWGRIQEAARPEGQHADAVCDTLAAAVATILAAGMP
ncbi:MAG: HAD family hydrolase [Acidobacteriota bacterium]